MARGRPRKSGETTKPAQNPAPEGQLALERELFAAADKLRKNLEPSDYKHVVLGLIFLRHISLAFEASITVVILTFGVRILRRLDGLFARVTMR